MPAEYIGTRMESGRIKWRPARSFIGTPEDGPDDRRFIIIFYGSLSGLPWISATPGGYIVDIDTLRASVELFKNAAWLSGKGKRQANVNLANNHFIIEVKL